MRNGIIYTIVDWILEKLKYLNLVEIFKYIAIKVYPKDKLTASRAGVDIFITIKWIIVIVLLTLMFYRNYITGLSGEIKGEEVSNFNNKLDSLSKYFT